MRARFLPRQPAYLFKIYLARVLGAEALGIYALGMTIVGLLGIFNALGLPYSAVRFVAAYSATGKLDLLRGFLGRSIFFYCSAILCWAEAFCWSGRGWRSAFITPRHSIVTWVCLL